ncbi:hypothetical protein HELRODRAFT_77575 [Helobdella robusta]|uniref:Chromatin assembly factor 1 subunit B n=1 Tax=Helobdella robusta TaxID=6412 RepID=T1G300_HELRO|nr:hypothetical protein HELRODRAFT_77575 [Helobdella robusta]ESO05786.1 hypothetical protein HELRODRAFT_77575 [Helobdella robusta]
MKFFTPEISWHGRDPLYSVDLQPIDGNIQRLATCGMDINIMIWKVDLNSNDLARISYLSTLSRHSKTVNVVRFSPDGKLLASGGDDSLIMLWQLTTHEPANPAFDCDGVIPSESWTVVKCLRSHLEDVYDVGWSKDGSQLLSGSVDNVAILWDVKKGVKLHIFSSHRSYVQGVGFDPLSRYLVTFSCDRSMKVYQNVDYKLLHDVRKISLGGKEFKIFHDDSMKSFFRRLSYSPDGQLLVVPSGIIEITSNTSDNQANTIINTTYLFSRRDLSKPLLHFPVPHSCKATLAVRFCPIIFKLRDFNKMFVILLPHRFVFAVATENSILIYDTQQPTPMFSVSNVHYDILSDLTWSSDGRLLIASSVDGYCTLIRFLDGDLGEVISSNITPEQFCVAESMEIVQNDQVGF